MGRFLKLGGTANAGFFGPSPATAPPAINWTSRAHPAIGFSLGPVVFGNGVFISLDATATNVQVARSADGGVTWTVQTILTGSVGSLGLTTDGAGTWMFGTGAQVASKADVWKSTDNGLTWALAAGKPFANDIAINSITFGAGLWLACGSNFPQCFSSVSADSGATWSVPVNLHAPFNFVCGNNSGLWDGTQFSVVGFNTGTFAIEAYTTTNGALGSVIVLPASSQPNNPLAFGNGQYMCANGGANVVFSAATIAGLAAASPQNVTFLGDTSDFSIVAVAFGILNGNPSWVALGDGGGSSLSTDNGATWTGTELNFQPPGGGFAARSVAYGAGTFVAVGSNDNISTLP